MGADTKQLLNKLSKTTDIKEFIKENEKEFNHLTCTEFLNDIVKQKGVSIASVVRSSGQGDYVYKIFNGERKPSRDVLIGIAVGLQLTIDETQLLLRISKMAILDPFDKRDSIIIYSIKEKHRVEQLNDLLYELDEQTI